MRLTRARLVAKQRVCLTMQLRGEEKQLANDFVPIYKICKILINRNT